MKFLQDPIKAKRFFILALTVSSVLFISVCLLSFLYLRTDRRADSQNTEVNKLVGENEELKEELAEFEKLQEDFDNMLETKESYESQIADMEIQIEEYVTNETEYEAKLSRINLYNIVLHYIRDIIVAHSDGTPVTEGEYQITKAKAEATGDTGLVSSVDNAWYNRDGLPIVRFAGVIWEIVEGIYSQVQ